MVWLKNIPPIAVSLTRSKMLAAKLLESEASRILHMSELGIITGKESQNMLSEVHKLTTKSTEIIEEHAARSGTRAGSLAPISIAR